jgi:hypothetical protein
MHLLRRAVGDTKLDHNYNKHMPSPDELTDQSEPNLHTDLLQHAADTVETGTLKL